MRGKLKFLIVMLSAFAMGFVLSSNYAVSDEHSKIAVVDVKKIIQTSSQVEVYQKEQEAKAQELLNFLEKVRIDIAKTTNTKKKLALEEKYNKEFLDKKIQLEREYMSKLVTFEKEINSTIAKYAQNNNYEVVLDKHFVLCGGTDITNEIIKAIK